MLYATNQIAALYEGGLNLLIGTQTAELSQSKRQASVTAGVYCPGAF